MIGHSVKFDSQLREQLKIHSVTLAWHTFHKLNFCWLNNYRSKGNHILKSFGSPDYQPLKFSPGSEFLVSQQPIY
jgi:hypothetical protein